METGQKIANYKYQSSLPYLETKKSSSLYLVKMVACPVEASPYIVIGKGGFFCTIENYKNSLKFGFLWKEELPMKILRKIGRGGEI